MFAIGCFLTLHDSESICVHLDPIKSKTDKVKFTVNEKLGINCLLISVMCQNIWEM